MSIESQPKPVDLRPKRRWFQFRLQTLLGLITVVAVGLGWIVSSAERQRRAVVAIRAAGGEVVYDCWTERPRSVMGEFPGPDWLCRLVGEDYFANVTHAGLPYGAMDGTVAHLSGLTKLHYVDLSDTLVSNAGLAHLRRITGLKTLDLAWTEVSDASLTHLAGLKGLRELGLNDTAVSDAGVADLRAALPGCKIVGP